MSRSERLRRIGIRFHNTIRRSDKKDLELILEMVAEQIKILEKESV